MTHLSKVVDRLKDIRPEKYFHVSLGKDAVRTSTSKTGWKDFLDFDPMTVWAALVLSSDFFVVVNESSQGRSAMELAVFKNEGGMEAMGLASFVGMSQVTESEQRKFKGDFSIIPGAIEQAYVKLPISSSLGFLRAEVETLVPVRAIGSGYALPEPMDIALLASALGTEGLSYEIYRLLLGPGTQKDTISPLSLDTLRESWRDFGHKFASLNSKERALLHEMQSLSRQVPI